MAARGNPPYNALPAASISKVVSYIRSHAATHGIPLPAAPRGRGHAPPIYLPTSSSKKQVFSEFLDAEDDPLISYETFRSLWKIHCADVIVQRPHSDVWAKCDKLRGKVRHAKTEEDTQHATTQLQQHLSAATMEREYYNSKIADAKAALSAVAPGEIPAQTHITFDFAQQLELPQHTRQVGPLYFKSRFRVQIFGICNEAQREQVNYLFHEGETIGKDCKSAHGAHAVISMIHHHLEDNPHQKLFMHADNCVGQNKNQYVIGYLCWRVLCGLSDSIHLSFMRVGHTRCSVDGYFGLLKMKYRNTEVDSMDDVVQVVNSSCSANLAQRYSWEWMEWDTFLKAHFKAIPGITKYQHFSVSKDSPGRLNVKSACDGESVEIHMFRPGTSTDTVKAAGMPLVLSPGGLSQTRLQYLQKEIQPFLTTNATPLWSGSAAEPAEEEEDND